MVKEKAKTDITGDKDVVQKRYELMFILEPGMISKKQQDIVKSIKDTITSNGGNIFFEDLTWGERVFTYPIKKFESGFYGVFGFDVSGIAISEIEEALRIEPSVIRSLIIAVPKEYKYVKYIDVKDHYDIFPEVKSITKVGISPKVRAMQPKKPVTTATKNLEDILTEEI